MRRNNKGFSLVEITLALMIGSIGLLALSGILTYVMKINRMATDISIATALARQKIEQVKLTEYNKVQNETEYEYNLNASGESDAATGMYTRVTEVAVNQPAFNTKTVSVSVYFSPDMQETEKKAVVSTIIYP
ncbi:MAG TPA: type II secretion system protein [archaeon]|nr:type II secretion system protein [archaeon]